MWDNVKEKITTVTGIILMLIPVLQVLGVYYFS